MKKAPVATKAECPSCGAVLTVAPRGGAHDRFQCPKCLNTIDLAQLKPGEASGRRESGRAADRPQVASGDGPATQGEQDVHALVVEAEVLAAENTALKSTLEGLQAEREAVLSQHVAFVDEIRDLKRRLAKAKDRAKAPRKRSAPAARPEKKDRRTARLEAELEKTRLRLAAAEIALQDSARLLSRLAQLEAQVLGLGQACVQAVSGPRESNGCRPEARGTQR